MTPETFASFFAWALSCESQNVRNVFINGAIIDRQEAFLRASDAQCDPADNTNQLPCAEGGGKVQP